MEDPYEYACDLSGDGLVLTLQSKKLDVSARFHSIWLRDNAWDEGTRAKANGQRLITLKDLPRDCRMTSAVIVEGEGTNLPRRQRMEVTFAPEANKTVEFDLAWLMENRYDKPASNARARGRVSDDITLWDAKGFKGAALPTACFDDIIGSGNEEALHNWLGQLVRFGVVHMTGGPVEDLALMKVVDLFGYVRETNYGRHFEVRTEVNPSNLAYTGLGLQAHTDNPYRDPVPTIQVLYCLESSAEGGASTVIDGFAAARRLQEEKPEYFDALADHCANFEFSSKDSNDGIGVKLSSKRRPMIELAPGGELVAVRFNNRSAAAFTDIPFDKMQLYYEAYRRFGEILEDPQMEVTFRLNPGECFIVDNTRVLHARQAYSGTGTRWLQGAYADKDGLLSTYHALGDKLRYNAYIKEDE